MRELETDVSLCFSSYFYFSFFFSPSRKKKMEKKRKEKAKIKIKIKSLIYLSLSRLLSSLTNKPSNHNNSLLFGMPHFSFFFLDQYMNTSPSQAGTYLI